MSIDFKRISRTTVSALGATSLLAASLAVTTPSTAQAETVAQPATLAEADAQTASSVEAANARIASINSQMAEVGVKIAQLETEAAEIQKQIDEQWTVVLQIWKKDYMRGDSSGIELIASRDTASELFSQQEYDGQFSEQLQGEVNKLFGLQDENKKKLDEAKALRDGLVKLRDSEEQQRSHLQAVEDEKRARDEATLGQQALYDEMKRQQAADSIASAVTPRAPQSGDDGSYGGGGAAGLTGSIGYARAGGNCVDEPGVNNPRNGNPINWPVTSSSPSIGATALWTTNHTGVVTGIWSNGDIEVRHRNWSGGQHRFPRGAFRGFR